MENAIKFPHLKPLHSRECVVAKGYHRKSASQSQAMLNTYAKELNKSYGNLITRQDSLDKIKNLNQSIYQSETRSRNSSPIQISVQIERKITQLVAFQRQVYKSYNKRCALNPNYTVIGPALKAMPKQNSRKIRIPKIRLISPRKERQFREIFNSSLSGWNIDNTRRGMLTPTPKNYVY